VRVCSCPPLYYKPSVNIHTDETTPCVFPLFLYFRHLVLFVGVSLPAPDRAIQLFAAATYSPPGECELQLWNLNTDNLVRYYQV